MDDFPPNMDYGAFLGGSTRRGSQEAGTSRGGSQQGARHRRRTSGGGHARSHSVQGSVPQTQVPETQSAPTQMSIEDFVSQPNREHCKLLDPLLRGNSTW